MARLGRSDLRRSASAPAGAGDSALPSTGTVWLYRSPIQAGGFSLQKVFFHYVSAGYSITSTFHDPKFPISRSLTLLMASISWGNCRCAIGWSLGTSDMGVSALQLRYQQHVTAGAAVWNDLRQQSRGIHFQVVSSTASEPNRAVSGLHGEKFEVLRAGLEASRLSDGFSRYFGAPSG